MRTMTELLANGNFDACLLPAELASTLPRECYVSPEMFDHEISSIWKRDWFCVGHVSHFGETGSFSVPLGADTLTLQRSDSGLSATSTQFPEATLCVDVWNSFVFVDWGTQTERLADRLAEFDSFVRPWEPERTLPVDPVVGNYDFDWKLMIENSLECYHCDFLHAGRHESAPARNTLPDPLPDNPHVSIVSVETTFMDAHAIAPYEPLYPSLRNLTPEQRSIMHWAGIMPNLSVGFYPDGMSYIITLPTGVGTCFAQISWMYPPETIALEDFTTKRTAMLERMQPLVSEDLDGCTRVQQGLNSSFTKQGRLAWHEETVAQFYRWMTRHYLADTEATVAA